MIKKMICIECPKSCELSVNIEGSNVTGVMGAKCPKGTAYAAAEVRDPVRILTATVVSEALALKMIPVRTNKPIPKKYILKAMEELRKIKVKAPVRTGDVIVGDLLGLGVKVVATRDSGRPA